jgi:hypothetical protein
MVTLSAFYLRRGSSRPWPQRDTDRASSIAHTGKACVLQDLRPKRAGGARISSSPCLPHHCAACIRCRAQPFQIGLHGAGSWDARSGNSWARRLAGELIEFSAICRDMIVNVQHLAPWHVVYNRVPVDTAHLGPRLREMRRIRSWKDF